jgi:hypothetical protein
LHQQEEFVGIQLVGPQLSYRAPSVLSCA